MASSSIRFRAQAATPTCPKHENEELDTLCVPCGERVCESCRGEHQGHEWLRMKRLVQIVRQNEKERCKELKEMVKKIKNRNAASSKQVEKDKIKKVQNELKLMVDDIAQMMISMVDGEDGENQAEITKETKILESMLDFFENHLHEADGNVIMEMEEEFYKKKQNLSSLQTTVPKVKFVEGTSSRDTMQHMFGKVIKENIGQYNEESEIKVNEISHFSHVEVKSSIRNISPISNTEAWIKGSKTEQIDKVDHTGKVIEVRKLTCSPENFIIKDKNDIVFTLFRRKLIQSCSSSGRISDVIYTAPLIPCGICRSHDGGILVTMCSCDVPQITSDSYGEVHHFNKDGLIMNKFTNTEGKNHDKVFTYPYRVAQNTNLDLCVAEYLDKDFKSRLVILSISSKIKSVYTGQPALRKKFSCSAVSCDHRGRVLVADLHNHAVHLLREDGHFLQYVLTEQSPLFGPHSLGLHCDTLWVGCVEGLIRVYKYSDKE